MSREQCLKHTLSDHFHNNLFDIGRKTFILSLISTVKGFSLACLDATKTGRARTAILRAIFELWSDVSIGEGYRVCHRMKGPCFMNRNGRFVCTDKRAVKQILSLIVTFKHDEWPNICQTCSSTLVCFVKRILCFFWFVKRILRLFGFVKRILRCLLCQTYSMFSARQTYSTLVCFVKHILPLFALTNIFYVF